MTARKSNIFSNLPNILAEEQFSILLEARRFKFARIVSTGHVTPEGEWYDQERAEWVMVVQGAAGFQFEDEAHERSLQVGDFIQIEPHRRHRVTWTSATEPTIWLALYYDVDGQD